MRQANALSAFIFSVRFYEATDQLRARSMRSDVQSKPSTPKEHGTSCLSSQGTNQMIIQATQSSNWRHSSKLVGTFNLFIPCCRQGRAPKADFKPLFLFNLVGVAGFEPAISGSQNRRGRPGSSIHRCAPLPHGAFDGKSPRGG